MKKIDVTENCRFKSIQYMNLCILKYVVMDKILVSRLVCLVQTSALNEVAIKKFIEHFFVVCILLEISRFLNFLSFF